MLAVAVAIVAAASLVADKPSVAAMAEKCAASDTVKFSMADMAELGDRFAHRLSPLTAPGSMRRFRAAPTAGSRNVLEKPMLIAPRWPIRRPSTRPA